MLRAGIAAVHAALAIPAKLEKSEDGLTTAAPTKIEVKVRWHFLCDFFYVQEWAGDSLQNHLLFLLFNTR